MVETGNYSLAARLAGVAAARCEEMAYFHEPAEQKFRETYLEKLKKAMTESDFHTAFAEGKKMTIDEALNLALEVARGTERDREHSRTPE